MFDLSNGGEVLLKFILSLVLSIIYNLFIKVDTGKNIIFNLIVITIITYIICSLENIFVIVLVVFLNVIFRDPYGDVFLDIASITNILQISICAYFYIKNTKMPSKLDGFLENLLR